MNNDEVIKKIHELLAYYGDAVDTHGWEVDEFDETVTALNNLIAQEINKARSQLEEQYNDIFMWLLGEKGDFPESIPGKRYGFRTELRAKLAALKAKGGEDNVGK
jgi:hypothetical protein